MYFGLQLLGQVHLCQLQSTTPAQTLGEQAGCIAVETAAQGLGGQGTQDLASVSGKLSKAALLPLLPCQRLPCIPFGCVLLGLDTYCTMQTL